MRLTLCSAICSAAMMVAVQRECGGNRAQVGRPQHGLAAGTRNHTGRLEFDTRWFQVI